MVETITPPTREEIRRLSDMHYSPELLGELKRHVRGANRRAGLCVGLAVVGFFAAIYFAAQPTLIPYPIVYDPDGDIRWHGEASTTREERFIDVGLLEWVRWVRGVSSDETVFREDREAAGHMVHGKAAQKFAAYNKETIRTYKDPQRKVLVKVPRNDMTIHRRGAEAIITWVEIWTPAVGYGSETHRFEATLQYAWYARPAGFTAAQARKNPRRLYIIDYDWDEVRHEVR